MWSLVRSVVTIVVAAAIFLALSYTSYGRVVNTVVFTLLIVVIVVGLYMIELAQKNK